VKGKMADGVSSQYSSHYLGTVLFTLPRNVVYPSLLPLMRTPRLPVVDLTDAPADLNGLVRFAERRNLVSARVPSHFKSTTSQKLKNHNILNKITAKCLSSAVHLGLDQVVGEWAWGWEITLHVVGFQQ
jgi:hypothetical protein